jgi:hypothetical protein
MQTFLPYADFTLSARTLDYKRLGKQRVEAWQIYQIVTENRSDGGWINHPAVKMWRRHPNALAMYYNTMISQWLNLGYRNSMKPVQIHFPIEYPLFIGDTDFHNSHKSNLLRKDPEFYSQFGWNVPDNLPYVWPE